MWAPQGQRLSVMERVDQLVSGFLRRRYGTPIRRILAKLRSPLLNQLEQVTCNLCGGDKTVELAHHDKYALPLTSVMCRTCGLMYLNPRPSAKGYHEFYVQGSDKDGVYHVALTLRDIEPLLRRFFGPEFRMSEEDRIDLGDYVREKYLEHVGTEGDGQSEEALIEALEAKAQEHEVAEYDAYADDLYRYFQEFVPRGGKVFEMGAAWGKLLVPWRARHGCQVSGVEPRAKSVQLAKERLGIDLFQGFPATVSIPEQTYDAVFNVRTINHMLDPLDDLRHAWRWLKPGGIIGIDISDAVREAHYESFDNRVVEIDHPYMFTVNSLAAMLQKAGFDIVKREIIDTRSVLPGAERSPEYKQIRIVGRKSLAPVAVALPDPLAELSELLQGTLAWNARRDNEANVRRKAKKERRSKRIEDRQPVLLKRVKAGLRALLSLDPRSTRKRKERGRNERRSRKEAKTR